MVPGKDQIVLHASTEFKDALGKYAGNNGTTMAEVIRRAVSAYIGYDLAAEPARSRTPKYATKEEADAANLHRAALIRWGNKTTARLMAQDQAEPAMIIARATVTRDYDTLELLKAAAEGIKAETVEIENEETDD